MDNPRMPPGSRTPRLGERLEILHRELRQELPQTERIGCALYDPAEDLLKTFVHSTCAGRALQQYEFRMAGSPSLSDLARRREVRFLPDLPSALDGRVPHSAWVLQEGYRSSFTVPMYLQDSFIGFVFFDSRRPDAFSPADQRTLRLHAGLISLMLANECLAIRALLGSVSIARAFCDLRDFETGAHLERMARLSRLIARDLAEPLGLSDEFVEQVFLFAPLHDIGKIGIPDAILLKPGRLDPGERRIMQTHVERGIRIIERMLDDLSLGSLSGVDILRHIVESHHELLDGSGYPRGLMGDAIPIEARIVTIADIFDALTSRRPYKEPWSVTQALEEMERLAANGQLDARGVQALRRQAGPAGAICARYSDPAESESA